MFYLMRKGAILLQLTYVQVGRVRDPSGPSLRSSCYIQIPSTYITNGTYAAP